MTTNMRPTERQKLIVDHVDAHGRVSVDELAAAMSISRETIRRDLAALAGKGLIFKFHGGARPLGATRRARASEGPFQARMNETSRRSGESRRPPRRCSNPATRCSSTPAAPQCSSPRRWRAGRGFR